MWSRSLSLTLGGDESYYRDGSCGAEVFLWHWEEMKVITETGRVVQKSFSDTGRRWKLLQRRVVWSRSISLTLRGDESYYRDGSREVEVFLWHWEEMKFITETGHVVQKSFYDTGRRWKLLQRRVVWSRSLSLTLGGDESYYRDGSCGVEVFLWHWEEMKVITETGRLE